MISKSNLEAIVNSSSDAIVTADAAGMILSWNPAAERVFGHSAREAVGQSLTLIMPERYRAAHDAGLARVAASGETRVMGKVLSLTGLHRAGHEFPLELTLSTWIADGMRFFGGILRDQSERARLADDLARSERQLNSIMEAATDAIICADADNTVVFWNSGATRMLGHSADEMIGKSLSSILPERFRALHEAGLKRVAERGERRVIGKTVQLGALHKSGAELPIELSLSCWEDAGQTYFGGIVRDISDRVHLVDELSQSEERMRSIMESANDAIICADAKGRIILWNPAAEHVLGHRHDDVIGKPLTVIIPKRYRSAHRQGLSRVVSGGERHVIGKTVELQAVHAEGHELPIELSIGTWQIEGERYFSGIIRDVTERKASEAQIASINQSLDTKNRQLESLSVKLAKYLSKQVYNSIFEGRTDVRVVSYRKRLTVFFSDIKGFTELTDKMEAETLSELLNSYLGEMAGIAESYGGTIDKFIGDGIMIFFGDPETRGEREDAIACVEMALKMRDRISVLCREWHDSGVVDPLHVRIGVNSGYCTVGNFGSEDRMDYTIVGGQVNITSRLETAAAPDQILISHATYGLVKDRIACRPVGEITVKGVAHPIRTYEAVGLKDAAAPAPTDRAEGELFETMNLSGLDTEARKRAKERLLNALKELDD